MEFIETLFLGIVQGVTEWLPISSSGHLVIVQELFGIKAGLVFDLMLHLATLFVILLVFYKDVIQVLKALFKLDFKSENGKLFLFIMVGSIPAALAGFFFKDFIYFAFSNLLVVSLCLLFTGFLLFLTSFQVRKKSLNYKTSFVVGIFQALALLPGVSRSGATISSGLFLGIERKKIVRFSFLLYIPAVIGAMIFLLSDVTGAVIENPFNIIIGMAASIVVGYISLKAIIKIVLNKKLHWFSIYCWVVAIIILILIL